jgi:multidrug efflux system membrane fusion protein
MNIVRTALIAAVIVPLAACGPEPDADHEVRPVRVERVAARDLGAVATYSGEIRARVEVPLAFRVAGKVAARMVDVGATVKAGQVLARLDPQDLNLSTQSLEAQRAAAQADLDFTKAEHERFKELLERKLVSHTDYQTRLNAFNTAKARYDSVQAQFQQGQNQSGYATLTADRNGVITSVAAEAGQVVAAGQTVFQLAVPTEKEVPIAVPENRLQDLQGIGAITISLWAQPDVRYKGRLREVSPASDPVTRTYAARITLLDADDRAQLGMTANVSLARASGADLKITLPTTALLTNDSSDAKTKATVWVVDPQLLTVAQQPVSLGGFAHNRVVVTGGLPEGALVVTAGVNRLHAGQKVKLLESAAPDPDSPAATPPTQ